MARILVVDDDEIMREMMEQMLSAAGYVVCACCNGTEAVAAITGEHYDLAVVDMVMPGDDGFSTVEKLTRAQPGIGIIAVSGGDRSFDGTTYLDIVGRRGAHCTLVKPFERDIFLSSVANTLEKTS